MHNRSREADLDEEIETHLALLADEQIRRGVPPADARAAAKAAFGGVGRIKEAHREARGLPLVETLLRDARYGLRALRRNPGFAITAILTLALGIGANTAIFSVVDALMLRQLPVVRPHELVRLTTMGPRGTDHNFSYTAFQQFRAGGGRSIKVTAAGRTAPVRASVDGESELLNRKAASDNYFAVLGVPAVTGRTFTAGDDNFGVAPPVAVLSHRYFDAPLRAGRARDRAQRSPLVLRFSRSSVSPLRASWAKPSAKRPISGLL